MTTFNIPAWTLVAHAVVPISFQLIARWREDNMDELSTKDLALDLIKGIALGTLFSCVIAHATPPFHRTFSIVPSFVRESSVVAGYGACSLLGLFLYKQLEARLPD